MAVKPPPACPYAELSADVRVPFFPRELFLLTSFQLAYFSHVLFTLTHSRLSFFSPAPFLLTFSRLVSFPLVLFLPKFTRLSSTFFRPAPFRLAPFRPASSALKLQSDQIRLLLGRVNQHGAGSFDLIQHDAHVI